MGNAQYISGSDQISAIFVCYRGSKRKEVNKEGNKESYCNKPLFHDSGNDELVSRRFCRESGGRVVSKRKIFIIPDGVFATRNPTQ